MAGMKGKKIMFKITDECKAVGASYLRSTLATVLTVILAGETDPKAIWAAFVAAAVPPVLRWLNPADKAFGRK